MRYLLLTLSLLGFATVNAATVNLDFEGDWGVADAPFPYIKDGFQITAPLSTQGGMSDFDTVTPGAIVPPFATSDYMLWCAMDSYCGIPDNRVILSRSNGGAFSIHSLDVGYLLGNLDVGVFNIIGELASGGTIVDSFQIVDNQWNTRIFSAAWGDLLSVEFDTDGEWAPAMDNIVVSAVPIPAAVWLFGSALAGLGWMRRKQTV